MVNAALHQRAAGVLLHVTSLPSPYGIGDLGPGAYAFIDFLAKAGQRYWQILPLTPTSQALCNSPYSSYSAFAGNPLLISPELLVEEGYIKQEDAQALECLDDRSVDFVQVNPIKEELLNKAFLMKRDELLESSAFQQFCEEEAFWLDNYSRYIAYKKRMPNTVWKDWPPIDETPDDIKNQILHAKVLQYIFFTQWNDLKEYANDKGILIIGDVPIYVNYDSADVWSYPEIFKLDASQEMITVAGVPPDYFSKTGQLWGNPVYDWDALKKTGYDFWMKRLKHNLTMYDVIRIDHFRGLVQFWEVDRGEKTAMNGRWADVPVRDFLNTVKATFPNMPIIAEDLGIITDDVKEIIHDYELPGMKILMFAFGDHDQNPYLPHNYEEHCVVYTGTHDNNTTLGWFLDDIVPHERERMNRYLSKHITAESVVDDLINLAYQSKANTVIIPMQDILKLDTRARMNTPSTIINNWVWRTVRADFCDDVATHFYRLSEQTQRLVGASV